MSKQLAAGAGVTIGATLAMGGVAHAADLTVGSTDDTTGAADCAVATNTDCTLRQAILDATANSDPDLITFRSGVSGTITLSGSQLPTISYPTTISGPGAGQVTVSGNNLSRVFDINTLADGADVRISGLTITRGNPTSVGGGIRSQYADLTVANAVVSGNTAYSGGGIEMAYQGSLTIESSTIAGNTATQVAGRGGGVETANGSYVPTTIRSSTISGNHSPQLGGGAYLDFNQPASIKNSTIYGNSTDGSGGGVYDYGAPPGDPGLTVTGSTITHNTAGRGGGIASRDGAGYTLPTLQSTIVSGNTAAVGSDLSAYSGSMTAGFSLIGSVDPASSINQTGPNILGQIPQLGPLANNGGATKTQKPAATSPAIDKGKAFGLTSDQVGLGRPVDFPGLANAAGGDGSDIGAFEVQRACAGQATPSESCATPTSTSTGERAGALARCKRNYKRALKQKRTHDALTGPVKQHLKKKLRKCKRRAQGLPV